MRYEVVWREKSHFLLVSLVHLWCWCVKSDRSLGSDQIIGTDGIKHTGSLKSKGIKSKSKRSSSPLFQRDWVCKGTVWGNSYFASGSCGCPSLWRVLSSLSFKMKKMKLAEGIASMFSLGIVHSLVAGSFCGCAGQQISSWTCRSHTAKISPKLPSRNTTLVLTQPW